MKEELTLLITVMSNRDQFRWETPIEHLLPRTPDFTADGIQAWMLQEVSLYPSSSGDILTGQMTTRPGTLEKLRKIKWQDNIHQ
eukprot:11278086-Ditylum_brightwellii.AAC.1